jgi:molybdopterin-guanine dinucleotide biosynthesis protein A
VNCYVLTGGRSTRMGTSKAELFLPRIVAAARLVFEDVIAMDRVGPDGVTAPIFGVQAALQIAQARCFVIAVDYPLITSEILRDLRDRGGVPMWNERPQPLCATWDAALLPLIERRIAERKLDLVGLLAEAKAEIIAESVLRARHRGEPLMNVNTPEELAEAERLYG